MSFLDKIMKKENQVHYHDEDIVSVATGTIIPANEIKDEVFAQEMMGQTIAFQLKDGCIVSPANGKLEVVYPTGHAFAVRMTDGTGLLVHIGINTVAMNGKGFKILHKQNDIVKAGDPIVKVDLNAIKKAGYDSTTMLIITEDKHIDFIGKIEVEKGEKINE